MIGLPLPVWAGLLLTPLFISAGQVLFKLTSQTAGDAAPADILRLMTSPYMLLALTIYGIGTLVWIYVLKAVPLTVAYPFMALTFCAVPLLAWVLLGESLDVRYALGTGLIVLGLLVINT